MKYIKTIGIIAVIIVVGFLLITSQRNDVVDHSARTQSQANTTGDDQAPRTSENTINIQDFAFSPAKITVKRGSTVTWTNMDNSQHDIRPDNPSGDFKPSKLLAKGESYSYTFEKSGMYDYHCSPHPYMKATVEVIE